MHTITRIDHMDTNLQNLKARLSGDDSIDEQRFYEVLRSAIDDDNVNTEKPAARLAPNNRNIEHSNIIPNWVDLDYTYEPNNPRKPNMRELIEAVSGKSVEEFYTAPAPDKSFQKLSSQASETLYGVLGANQDSRDWTAIMDSKNIFKTAQNQTAIMFEPKVEIVSMVNETKNINEEIAVIKDKHGNTLRSLSSDLSLTEQTLHNFGVTRKDIPSNLEAQVDQNIFDRDLLNLLKNFDNEPSLIERFVIHSASTKISEKLSQNSSLAEFEKL